MEEDDLFDGLENVFEVENPYVFDDFSTVSLVPKRKISMESGLKRYNRVLGVSESQNFCQHD